MGCGGSKTAEDEIDAKINQQLKDDRKKYNREIKLLLLGTGESGKSTIAKQLKILHMDGFAEAELLTYKPVITNNILTAYKNIIHATETFGQLPKLLNSDLKDAVAYFQKAEPLKDELSPIVATYVKLLFADPIIQETLAKYSMFQLPDSTYYLTESIDRICDTAYVPTQEDVLRCRARTTGIIELDFNYDTTKFKVVDVGGQRSERKKWIHIFEGVTAIIFCVALNEYLVFILISCIID
jgi:guanine nucleotide-binding protein G(i) subunit alpha